MKAKLNVLYSESSDKIPRFKVELLKWYGGERESLVLNVYDWDGSPSYVWKKAFSESWDARMDNATAIRKAIAKFDQLTK